MSKFIKKAVLMLVLIFALTALAACSKDEPAPEPTATPTTEPTKEATPEPTKEATPEPTAEPTVEPTAEPTEEPTAEPTAEPTEDPDINGAEVEDDEIKSINEIAADTDEAAIEIATSFMDSIIHGKTAESVSMLAYDESKAAAIAEALQSSTGSVPEEIAPMLEMLSLKVSGAKRATAEDLSNMSPAFVDLGTVSDLHVVTVRFSSDNAALAQMLGQSFMNMAVGKYNGEYKVITYATGVDASYVIPDNGGEENPEYELQVIGADTADEMIKLYADAYSILDLDTLVGCIALNEENAEKFSQAMQESTAALEMMKGLLGDGGVDVTVGDAEKASADEIKFRPDVYVDLNEVSDIVKYPVTMKTVVFGQESVTESYIYIGKYNGQYRVISQANS